MSPFIKRVISGMGANAYGQLVSIVIQLISLPIYLSKWNLETYGVWLTLAAIPAYFSMADIGMVSVAGTRMTILVGKGDLKTANRVFQSAQLFVGLSCLAVAAIAFPIIFLSPFDALQPPNTRTTLFILVLVVLLSMACGLVNAVYKATHRYALGIFMETNTRLLEWLGAMIGFFWSGTFLAIAIGMFAARAIAFLALAFLSTNGSVGLTWGTKNAASREVKQMIAPSLGYMTFPISNALSFQGYTLLAAAILGPLAVAIFSIYRTLARIVVQATSILSHALSPELSRLFGAGHHKEFKKIALRSTAIGVLGSLLMSAVVFLASPYLLQIWAQGKVPFTASLMALFLLYAAIAGCWHIPRIVLMAVNRHSKLGTIVLIVSIISLMLAWVLGKIFGIEGLVASMMVAELLITIVCMSLAQTLTNDPEQ